MHVFMDIIQKVVDVEDYQLQRKAAAEAEAKQIIAEAERNGLALLQQTREAAAESGKALLREAEDRAARRAGEPPEGAILKIILCFGLRLCKDYYSTGN